MENKIIADLKESYGITVNQFAPVTGGLMNLKWRVSSEKGELLVKQYSTRRFSREQIERIESRLQRQIILKENGVRCPFLWKCRGHIIRWLDSDTVYMVMDFHPGKTENSDTITIPQMRSLGIACAVMHKAFSRLPVCPAESLPVWGGYTIDLLWENFNSLMMKCPPDSPAEYRKTLLAQKAILNQLNAGFFDRFPKGFAHEDFHSGNILFDMNCVSSIVDFDRNCYSYIWHDVGRAILSFALESDAMNKGHYMNVEKVRAFLEGYSQHLPLTLHNIADALRLSWCIETPWFIRPEYFEEEINETGQRLKDEILWLTEHWFEIDSIICSK